MEHMQVTQVEDFRGYIKRCDAISCRYFPVYQRGKGSRWYFYKNGKRGYKYFSSVDAVINFFNS